MTPPKEHMAQPPLRDAFDGTHPALLVQAIDRGADHKKIQALLQQGASPHTADDQGRTPVDAAMAQNAYETVRLLMAAGAKPPVYEGDPNGPPVCKSIIDDHTRAKLARQTALTYFIRHDGSFSTIFRLLCNGADVNLADQNGLTPLAAALERKWPYVATQLVKEGAWINPDKPDINEVVDTVTGMTRLMAVILEGRSRTDVAQILAQGADPDKADKNGLTPLALARALHWPAVEKDLLDYGAQETPFPDPNQMCGDKTLLGYALSYQACHSNYIYGLLQAGANPDRPDETGKTALHWAAVFGKTALFREMLARGANPDVTDKHHWKPLHYACMNGHAAIVEDILDQTQGADINVPVGEMGHTPLMLAARGQKAYDTVKTLIDRGALVNMQDMQAETALAHVVHLRDPRMVKLLIDHGADVAKRLPPPDKENMPAHARHNNPPLFTLASSPNKNNLAIARLLLDAGANPNDTAIESFNGPQKGDSLIHGILRYHETLAFAELLLQSGADPHGTAHNGATAMHHCLHMRHIPGVQLLLQYGFDPLRHFDYTETWSNGTIDHHTGSCLDEARKLVEKFGTDSEYGQMLSLIETHIAAQTPAPKITPATHLKNIK